MDPIVHIRQMMAEQKYLEAQGQLEVQLKLPGNSRFELLSLYDECLRSQHKELPVSELLELASLTPQNEELLSRLDRPSLEGNFVKVKKLLLAAEEARGRMDGLYHELSDFLVRQYEKQNPVIPSWVSGPIEKYFRHDFNLRLKELALCLMVQDLVKAEALTIELITSCLEKSSPKGVRSKLLAIAEVLQGTSRKGALDIYQNFTLIYAQGLKDKSDFKRIVEMIIYFDDFKLQVLVLNLLHELNLLDEARSYAVSVRSNKQYNFVYFDKYFSQLKKYFIHQTSAPKLEAMESVIQHEARLISDTHSLVVPPALDFDETPSDQNISQLFKYQDFTPDQLCELAVSFLQSEMPSVALEASTKAVRLAPDDVTFLKGSYLKLTSLLQLKDYRAALDTCLEALSKARTQNDVLSFMYGQAEIYIRLNDYPEARKVLSKILSIDSHYRMAKERLDKL